MHRKNVSITIIASASGSPAGSQTFEKFDKQVVTAMPAKAVETSQNPFVQIFKACPREGGELAPGGLPEAPTPRKAKP